MQMTIMKALRHHDESLSLRRGVYIEAAWLLQGTRALTVMVTLRSLVRRGCATDGSVAVAVAAGCAQARFR